MSILFENDLGYIISHHHYFSNIQVVSENHVYSLNSNLFDIHTPFVKPKSKDDTTATIEHKLTKDFASLISAGRLQNIYNVKKMMASDDRNSKARQTAADFYKNSIDFIQEEMKFHGSNTTDSAVISSFAGQSFIFPRLTRFYCGNIQETIHKHLKDEYFDVIIMDPPWKNKYIWRNRKRRQGDGGGYALVNNDEIKDISIDKIAAENALVVFWCTNAVAHQNELINSMFPNWGIQFLTTWYWIKVTTSGEPICPFSADLTKKQPYETIIIGQRISNKKMDENDIKIPISTKLIIGVPSSLHSHKPPLVDILRKYSTNPDAKFCEFYARYLTPGVTSIGNEVIKLQHTSLYTLKSKNDDF